LYIYESGGDDCSAWGFVRLITEDRHEIASEEAGGCVIAMDELAVREMQ
jgi:hypothetical protein